MFSRTIFFFVKTEMFIPLLYMDSGISTDVNNYTTGLHISFCCYMINLLFSTEGIGCKRGYVPHGIVRVKSDSYGFFLTIQDDMG